MSITEPGVARTSDLEIVRTIATRLLVGTRPTEFRYSGLFSLDFSRESRPSDPKLPMVVALTFRSDWWIGDKSEWLQFLSKHPEGFLEGKFEDAIKGYALMCLGLSGARVDSVDVDSAGSLSIRTSVGKTLTLSGREDIFEESWIIDVPPGVPNHEFWSVVCTDRGELIGRQPAE